MPEMLYKDDLIEWLKSRIQREKKRKAKCYDITNNRCFDQHVGRIHAYEDVLAALVDLIV
jgi:hypothetical protein